MKTYQEYIEKLAMVQHWENGYISPTIFTSHIHVNGRPIADWVYYLLPEDRKCPLHLIRDDESWNYCAGGPLDIFTVKDDKTIEKTVIGPDLDKKHQFFKIIPANTWQCAMPQKGSLFTLVSHCLTPAFNRERVNRGYKEDLYQFIDDEKFIEMFCWENNNEFDSL